MRGAADLAEKASGQRMHRELHRKERHSGCYLEYGCETVIICFVLMTCERKPHHNNE